jgi:hypothetical protein
MPATGNIGTVLAGTDLKDNQTRGRDQTAYLFLSLQAVNTGANISPGIQALVRQVPNWSSST